MRNFDASKVSQFTGTPEHRVGAMGYISINHHHRIMKEKEDSVHQNEVLDSTLFPWKAPSKGQTLGFLWWSRAPSFRHTPGSITTLLLMARGLSGSICDAVDLHSKSQIINIKRIFLLSMDVYGPFCVRK